MSTHRIDPVVVEALQQAGAVHVRTSKHYIYQLPNGQTIVVACSPGDVRNRKNLLAQIRRSAAMPRRRS